MRLVIALSQNGKQLGEIQYDLKDKVTGGGTLLSVETNDPEVTKLLKRKLTGNPDGVVVASTTPTEVAGTIDGVEHVLHQFKQDFGIDFDRDAIPRPSILRRKGLVF